MDPLSALAIAAAVVQFVDIGAKLVNKAWSTYSESNEKERKSEDERLAQTTSELSFLVDGLRNASSTLPTVEAATPAQLQLARICSDCQSVAAEFSQILDRIKAKRAKDLLEKGGKRGVQGRAEAIYRNLPGFRLSAGSKSKLVEDPNDLPIAKDAITSILKRLEPMRRQVIDSVVLCLWEDSKQTKQWELRFSNKLEALTEVIRKVDLKTETMQQERNLGGLTMDEDDIFTQHTGRTELVRTSLEGLITLPRLVLPLVQASQTMSLSQVGNRIIQKLNDPESSPLRKELVATLWHRDWKLDAAMVASSAITNHMVAQAISKDAEFDTMQVRENAIVESVEETYSWIFQQEPKVQDNKPMWHSFPKWLADESNAHPFYWITGKPGSGKSTMMKYLLQSPSLGPMLTPWADPLPLLIVRFYAWNAGSTLQKSFDGLKRTIISQALHLLPELAPIISPRRWALFNMLRREPTFPPWDTWELEESFDALLSECGKSLKLVLFVDGLDEFGVPAKHVVELFQTIRHRCGRGFKACVASRPWTDFDDAYSDSPMLEIHRFTRDDMSVFVKGSFKEHKGFNEQRLLSPEAADNLLTDIVDKADGVFLWVSLVVEHLRGLFAGGRSIVNVKQVLTALPPDLSSLYDAIWASIPEDELPDGSWMMQLVKTPSASVTWFNMWLIEEMRVAPIDIDAFPLDARWKEQALKSVKRRLSTRTKGILEVSRFHLNDSGYVDFIHRTARDWAQQPEVWQRICESSSKGFNPLISLIEAETLLLSRADTLINKIRYDKIGIRMSVTWCLWLASEASDSPEHVEDLIRVLDSLGKTLMRLTRALPANIASMISKSSKGATNPNRYLSYTMPPDSSHCYFLSLAAVFSILPYIVAKTRHDRTLLSGRQLSAILQCAVHGYTRYVPWDARPNLNSDVPSSRRLATVQFLLEQGVTPTKKLKEEVRSNAERGWEYYEKVADLFEKKDSKLVLKGVFRRLQSAIKQ